MASDQITVQSWESSANKTWAVSLIARGYTQTDAAKIIEVPLRTMQRWCAFPEFREAVAIEQAELLADFDFQFQQLISSAMRVMQLVMDGELAGDSARATAAQETLSKTVYPMARRKADDRRRLPEADADDGQRALNAVPA